MKKPSAFVATPQIPPPLPAAAHEAPTTTEAPAPAPDERPEGMTIADIIAKINNRAVFAAWGVQIQDGQGYEGWLQATSIFSPAMICTVHPRLGMYRDSKFTSDINIVDFGALHAGYRDFSDCYHALADHANGKPLRLPERLPIKEKMEAFEANMRAAGDKMRQDLAMDKANLKAATEAPPAVIDAVVVEPAAAPPEVAPEPTPAKLPAIEKLEKAIANPVVIPDAVAVAVPTTPVDMDLLARIRVARQEVQSKRVARAIAEEEFERAVRKLELIIDDKPPEVITPEGFSGAVLSKSLENVMVNEIGLPDGVVKNIEGDGILSVAALLDVRKEKALTTITKIGKGKAAEINETLDRLLKAREEHEAQRESDIEE